MEPAAGGPAAEEDPAAAQSRGAQSCRHTRLPSQRLSTGHAPQRHILQPRLTATSRRSPRVSQSAAGMKRSRSDAQLPQGQAPAAPGAAGAAGATGAAAAAGEGEEGGHGLFALLDAAEQQDGGRGPAEASPADVEVRERG